MPQHLSIKYKFDFQNFILSLLFFMIITLYAVINYMVNNNIVILILTLLFPVLCIISVYCMNKYRFNKFLVLLQSIALKYQELKVTKEVIKVRKNSYTMKPFKQSNDVVINPFFEKSVAYYCFTENFIIIFIEMKVLFFFKTYCKPILFSKSLDKQFLGNQIKYITEYRENILESEISIESSQFPDDISALQISFTIISKYINLTL